MFTQEEIRARLPKYQRRHGDDSRQSDAVQQAVALQQQQQAVAVSVAAAAFQDQQQRQQAALSALQQQQQQQQQRFSRPPQTVMVPASAGMPVSSVALMAPLMRPTMTLATPLIHGGNMMRPPPMGLPPGKSPTTRQTCKTFSLGRRRLQKEFFTLFLLELCSLPCFIFFFLFFSKIPHFLFRGWGGVGALVFFARAQVEDTIGVLWIFTFFNGGFAGRPVTP